MGACCLAARRIAKPTEADQLAVSVFRWVPCLSSSCLKKGCNAILAASTSFLNTPNLFHVGDALERIVAPRCVFGSRRWPNTSLSIETICESAGAFFSCITLS
jgi:hypothetical protein